MTKKEPAENGNSSIISLLSDIITAGQTPKVAGGASGCALTTILFYPASHWVPEEWTILFQIPLYAAFLLCVVVLCYCIMRIAQD